MRNLTLYVKTGCPYCQKVLNFAAQRGMAFTLKNRADTAVQAELIARGGKRQVPYFVDEDAGIEMYESDDIIAYLGGSKPDQSKNPNVCPAF